MNISRPDLVDRPVGTPFQISTMRGHPVYCYYTVRISCPTIGTDSDQAASASVEFLADDANPPSASFGKVALTKQATLPSGAADRSEVIYQLCGVVLPGQWVELRPSIDSGTPTIDLIRAVEVES